ncbi:MAG: hypothetical protein ACI8WB_000764 [Phenylobacterium sp.]|jgi:hypothetical protein
MNPINTGIIMKKTAPIIATTIARAAARAMLSWLILFSTSAWAALPTFNVVFAPDTIGVGGATTMTYTIDNSGNATNVSDLAFTDTLPTDLIIATPSHATTTCRNGTYAATAGGTSISFSGYRLGSASSCTFSLDIIGTKAGGYVNTTDTLTSSLGSLGTANDTLTVDSGLPGFSMQFSPSTITPGEVSTITYTMDNSANGSSYNLAKFTHTLPAGLTISQVPNLTETCAGAADITGIPGSDSYSFVLSALASNEKCTATLNVTASTTGIYTTTTSNLTKNNQSPSGTATATLTVNEAFLYGSFPTASSPGSSVKLSFTLHNNDRSNPATNITFSSDLNATLSGLAATVLPADNFCGTGSTLTGASTITIAGASLAAEASCSFEVTVLIPASAAAGSYTNSTSTINLTQGSPTTKPAVTQNLVIKTAPLVTAVFIDDPVTAGQDVTLRYTITNTDPTNDATAIGFTEFIDDYLSGTTIKTGGLPNKDTCGNGSTFTSITISGKDEHFQLADASVLAGSSCTFDVILTLPPGAPSGIYPFTTTVITSTVNGSVLYGLPATDNLVVVSGPTLSMVLSSDYASPNTTATAQFTLTYPSTASADVTGLGFTLDILVPQTAPAPDAVSTITSTSLAQTDICGSGSTFSGTTQLTLSGGTLSAGTSCTFSVTLQIPSGTAPGIHNLTSSIVSGTSSAVTVQSANLSQALTVSGLTISQLFTPSTVLPGQTITSRYTITNDINALAATAIEFTHSLSDMISGFAGIGIPTTPCYGVSEIVGVTDLVFKKGELQPGQSCTFDILVQVPAGASEGIYNSTTTLITADVGGKSTKNPLATSTLTVEQLFANVSTTAADPTFTSPIPVTIHFSRSVVNFALADITVSNGTVSSFNGTGDTYIASITPDTPVSPSTDIIVGISLAANVADDSVDNNAKNTASNTLSLTYSSSAAFIGTLSSASNTLANTGPVSYTATYANVDSVSLTDAYIILNKTGTVSGTATVTNGTTTTPTITLSNITGDGTLGFSIASGSARDTNNVQVPAIGPSSTFTVDNTVPTVTITNTDSDPINTSFTATFTFNEDVTGFAVTDITAGNAQVTTFSAVSATVYTVIVTPTSDGTVTLDVAAGVATDAAGNGNSVATQYSKIYDATNPTLTISSTNMNVNAPFVATFTFDENVTGFADTDIAVTNGAASNFAATSATTYTATITPATPPVEGNILLNVAVNQAIDSASNGNDAAPPLSVVYDITLPTVTISGPTDPVKAPFTATITFNEDVTGLAITDISATNATLSTFNAASTTEYTVLVTPTADGNVALDLPASVANDLAGNANSAAGQYTVSYDATQPTVVITSPATLANAPYTATFTFSEAVSGFVMADITPSNATLDTFITVSSTVYTVLVTPTTDGLVTLDVVADSATDSATNGNIAATQHAVTYDATNPTVTISSPSLSANAPYTATIVFNELTTGFDVTDIVITNGTLGTLNTTRTGEEYTVTVTPTAEGPVTLNIAASLATDNTGNGNIAATQHSVSYDITSPTVTISSPSNAVNAAFTATITFSEDVTGFVIADITAVNATLSTFVATSASVYTVLVTPTGSDITLDINASIAIDAATNNNLVASQYAVTYDTVQPTVVISGPAGLINAPFTATFTFDEAVTGFTDTDIVFANATLSAFAATSTAVYTATITPTANGAVTLDVGASAAIDISGNANSAASQYSVTYDISALTATLSTTSADSSNIDFDIAISFNKSVTGLALTDFVVVNANLSNFTGSNDAYSVTVSPIADGLVTVAIAANSVVDAASNVNAVSNTMTITYDRSISVVQSLQPANLEIDVAVKPDLIITFDEVVVAGSSNNLIEVKNLATNAVLTSIAADSSSVTIAGSTASIVTVTLPSNLAEVTSYYVTIASGAFTDVAGNIFAGFASNNNWAFTVINLPPLTIADTANVDEDSEVRIDVLANDNGDNSALNPASVSMATLPTHGKTTINTASGVISYVPESDFNGTETFSYMVSDMIGTFSVATTVTVTVNSINDAPIAANEMVSVNQDNSIVIDVLANDSDVDGASDINSDTLLITTQPTHGEVIINNAKISYQPTASYSGSDSFKYSVSDNSNVVSNVATVSINVVGSNAAPVTVADTLSINEDQLAAIDILGNDSDSDGTLVASSVVIISQPTNGTVIVNSDGTLAYTPNANFFGNDSLSYTVQDNGGATSFEATVSIAVNSVNDAPVTTNDTIRVVDLTSTQILNVIANDDDVDGTISSISLITQPQNGTISIDSTTLLLRYIPSAGFSGTDVFSYQLTDNDGAISAATTVTLTLDAINEAPLANDDNVQTDEDQFITIEVLANDSDTDGQLIASSVQITAPPSHGTANVRLSDGAIFYVPTADFSGDDSFVYQVNDDQLATASATVNIRINNLNDAPIATTQNLSTNEDNNLIVTLTGSDADGDNLIFNIDRYPVNGTLTGQAANFTYQPNANFNGTDTLTYFVNDGTVDSATATITITVAAQNDQPLAVNQTLLLDEDTAIAVTLGGSDIDNDTLSYRVTVDPTNGQLSGTLPSLTYTANANFNGSDSFSFVSNDSTIDSETATVAITVTAINDQPIADNQAVQLVEDTPLDITLAASDVDNPALAYTIVDQPQFGTLIGTAPTVRYVPNTNFNGDDSFTFIVNDGLLDSLQATVSLTVTPDNDTPVGNPLNLSGFEDLAIPITIFASDVDGDSLSYTIATQPANGTLTGQAPDLTYTPNADFNGSDSFNYTASDATATSSPITVNITLQAVNDLPIAVDDSIDMVGWSVITIDVLANDSDIDGDTLSISAASANIGDVNISANQLSYTPVDGFTGTVVIDYFASDGQGVAAATAMINISAPPDGNRTRINVSDSIDINADALLTKVAPGIATATDRFGLPIEVSLVDDITFFKPGINTRLWQATDSKGMTTLASQLIKVHPLVSLDNDQVVLEDSTVSVGIHLNGISPIYPLSIPYTVSGSSDINGGDHTLTNGEVIIESGTEGTIRFKVLADTLTEGEETITITLDDSVNISEQSVHTLTISEGNVPPKVSFTVTQAQRQNVVVNQQDGIVVIDAVTRHPNADKRYHYQWTADQDKEQALLSDTDAQSNRFSFDPAELDLGIYHLQLSVVDADDEQYQVHQRLTIKVEQSAAVLGGEDSDNDGLADNLEGGSDTDHDGIADYLDNIPACNVMPATSDNADSFLVEGLPGICLRLGDSGLNQNTTGARVAAITPTSTPSGAGTGDFGQLSLNSERFDFVAYNLPIQGQVYHIVLPQTRIIPLKASFKVQLADGEFVEFIEDGFNQLLSSPGESGYCPPPGNKQWLAGLKAGSWCVQLLIEDGGVNDVDGINNGVIGLTGEVERLLH